MWPVNLLYLGLFSFPLFFVLQRSTLAVWLLKLISLAIDLTLLPIFIIVQQPWIAWKAARRVRAVREDPSDPESPFVRTGSTLPFDSQIVCCPTIDSWFSHVVEKYGNRNCLGTRPIIDEISEKQKSGKVLRKQILENFYEFTTYKEVDTKVNLIVSGLLRSGIRSGDKIALFAETREEWMLSALASWRMGASVVTMYANLGLDGITVILEQTQVTHIITTTECLDKLIKISSQLSHLKTIIYASRGPSKPKLEQLSMFNLIPFTQLYEDPGNPNGVSIKKAKSEDICCIMYTSGSTGVPKGVQISHNNFMSAMKALISSCVGAYQVDKHEAFLAYLPLAHIFEMGAEVLMLSLGIPICYSSPNTMLDSGTAIPIGGRGDIGLVKPTIMPAVPLILDRIKKTVEDKLASSFISSVVFKFAYDYRLFWNGLGFKTNMVDQIVFSKVRQSFGGQLKLMFVGGAPLSAESQEFIANSLLVKLLQGYAATEATACAALMDMDDRSTGRVGAPLFGAKVKLLDWEEGGYSNKDLPHPRGELIIGGPAITMGYYMNEEETAKEYLVDESGTRWWRSGDIGEIFTDGTIKIIDRKKDLVKLQHGEYISLGKIEAVLKNCPYVDNICVYGDSFHNNLIAFILPERKSLQRLAESLSKSDQLYTELCADQQIVDSVLKTLHEFALSKGLLRFEIPTKIKLCPDEWTPDNGLVTAALKIRRAQIQKFYEKSIKSLYS